MYRGSRMLEIDLFGEKVYGCSGIKKRACSGACNGVVEEAAWNTDPL